jgi:hypothetical protein
MTGNLFCVFEMATCITPHKSVWVVVSGLVRMALGFPDHRLLHLCSGLAFLIVVDSPALFARLRGRRDTLLWLGRCDFTAVTNPGQF